MAAGIRACSACGLHVGRTNGVPGEGPADARVCLLGEAPGQVEDETGRPFIGRSGEFLSRFLAERSIDRSSLFITGACKCRPPNNRDPKPEEYTTCGERWVVPQLDAIQPRLIVLAGKIALAQQLGFKGRLADIRGKIFDHHGRRYLPTYHPTALMRWPKLRAAAEPDWLLVKEVLDNAAPSA